MITSIFSRTAMIQKLTDLLRNNDTFQKLTIQYDEIGFNNLISLILIEPDDYIAHPCVRIIFT